MSNNKKIKHLRRGMLVRLSDGSTELVKQVFRFPANTKFRKRGCVMFQSKNYVYYPVYSNSVQILGFQNKKNKLLTERL